MPLRGRRELALDELDQAVLLEVVLVLGALLGQLHGRVDEEQPEDVEDPAEVVDRGGADGDEDAAHDQREHDADEQRALLQLLGYGELAHDDQEDEQVVDREGVLGQPAGEELGAVLVPGEDPDPDAEERPPSRRRRPSAMLTSLREGSCGRRPMTTMSKMQDDGGDADREPPHQGGYIHALPPDSVPAQAPGRLRASTVRRSLPPHRLRPTTPGQADRAGQTVMTRSPRRNTPLQRGPSLPDAAEIGQTGQIVAGRVGSR